MKKHNPDFWQCRRKSRYPTDNVALKYANKAMRERGIKLETYYCDKCKGYHLTSQYESNRQVKKEGRD